MNLLRCLLLSALIVASSATFSKRKGKCYSRKCGLTPWEYVPPSQNSGKCLGVFGFLSAGVSVKINLASKIFGSYSNIRPPTKLDDTLDTCVNLSRGIALILNQWIDGLGTIFENMIIGSTRCIFCVLRSPWSNGDFFDRWFGNKRTNPPVICNKDFGVKWGWKEYIFGYSRDEVYDFYGLGSVRVDIEALIEAKGYTINSLTGTKKVIIESMLKLADLVGRDFSVWDRDDYVRVCRYLIIISACVGRGYRQGTGVSIIDEFLYYLSIGFEKAKFKLDIRSYRKVLVQEVSSCDTDEFDGAFKVDKEIDSSSDNSGGSGSKNSGNGNNSGGSDSKNGGNGSNNGGNGDNSGGSGSQNGGKGSNNSGNGDNSGGSGSYRETKEWNYKDNNGNDNGGSDNGDDGSIEAGYDGGYDGDGQGQGVGYKKEFNAEFGFSGGADGDWSD